MGQSYNPNHLLKECIVVVIYGNDLNNTLHGTSNDDSIYGLGGDDDWLSGEACNDYIDVGVGNKEPSGGLGRDALLADDKW